MREDEQYDYVSHSPQVGLCYEIGGGSEDGGYDGSSMGTEVLYDEEVVSQGSA